MKLIKFRKPLINLTLISLLTLPAALPAFATEPAPTAQEIAEKIKKEADRVADRVGSEVTRSTDKTVKEVNRFLKRF